MQPFRSCAALLAACVLLLASAGCDALVEPGQITVALQERTFLFVIGPGQLKAGQTLEVASQGTVDLASELRDLGYGPADVVAARVTSARLERIQPLSVMSLQFLERATLSLRAGTATTTVAEASSFPASTKADLPLKTADAAAVVRSSAVGAVLRLTPVQVNANDSYRLEVRVAFSAQVEGV